MERWIIDVNSERYSNNASIQRLSECLDKEKLYRMKSDVTREIVGKEREKIEDSYVELENQCKQLEIDSRVIEARTRQLYVILQEKVARIQELGMMLKKKDEELKISVIELEKEKIARKAIEEQKEKLEKKLTGGKAMFTL